MAPYIVTNKDITIKQKILNQTAKEGMILNVEGAVKFLSSNFLNLNNLNNDKESELTKKQANYKHLFTKLKIIVEKVVQDPRGKRFLDGEV